MTSGTTHFRSVPRPTILKVMHASVCSGNIVHASVCPGNIGFVNIYVRQMEPQPTWGSGSGSEEWSRTLHGSICQLL